MASASTVLSIAASQLGYNVSGSQPSVYGSWMADAMGESWLAGSSSAVPWCMIFVSWVFNQAGQSCPGLPCAHTDTALSAATNAGIVVSSSAMAPGDIVIFEWGDGTVETDHVGIVESVCGGYYQTIEGNTGYAGDTSGWVARQTRYYDATIAGVIRPPYDGSAGSSMGTAIAEDGYWGRETTAALQRHYGTVVDGEVWHQWEPNVTANPVLIRDSWMCDTTALGSPLIRAMQADLGTEIDGIFGAPYILAIKTLFGGYYGDSETMTQACVWELQHQLNGGIWPKHL